MAKRRRGRAVHIIDSSKATLADFRHRAMLHHAGGIYLLQQVFSETLTLSTGRVIPTRWVGEQHVREDLGDIPSFADWARAVRPEPWMGRTPKIEEEVEPMATALPIPEGSLYLFLEVAPDASGFAVLRAAARLFHPVIFKDPGLRPARRKFYRAMLTDHAKVKARAGRSTPSV